MQRGKMTTTTVCSSGVQVVTAEDRYKDCSRSLMTEKCGHPRFTGHTIWTDMEQIDTTLEKTYLKAKD